MTHINTSALPKSAEYAIFANYASRQATYSNFCKTYQPLKWFRESPFPSFIGNYEIAP